MDIKEIALKVAKEMAWVLHSVSLFPTDESITFFATALLSEVQKQNEPVATREWNDKAARYDFNTDGNNEEYLYTFPPIPEPQWRTIESAPKDGTEILLYSETYGVDVAHFHRGKWRTTAGQCDIEYPTHWMKLPEAPKGEQ